MSIPKKQWITLRASFIKLKLPVLSFFYMTLLWSCKAQETQIIQNQSIEVIKVASCDSSTLLSKSPLYIDFDSTASGDKKIISDFTKQFGYFSKRLGVTEQKVIKHQREDGVRIYESDPQIFYEKRQGSWADLKGSIAKRDGKCGALGCTWSEYRFGFDAGPSIKDPIKGTYSLDPSKFKVYLYREYMMPEWHAVGNITSRQRAKWDKRYCRLSKHEREHAEITREHFLETIDAVLNLRSQTPSELIAGVRNLGESRWSDLNAKQKAFDVRTRHGTRRSSFW